MNAPESIFLPNVQSGADGGQIPIQSVEHGLRRTFRLQRERH